MGQCFLAGVSPMFRVSYFILARGPSAGVATLAWFSQASDMPDPFLLSMVDEAPRFFPSYDLMSIIQSWRSFQFNQCVIHFSSLHQSLPFPLELLGRLSLQIQNWNKGWRILEDERWNWGKLTDNTTARLSAVAWTFPVAEEKGQAHFAYCMLYELLYIGWLVDCM